MRVVEAQEFLEPLHEDALAWVDSLLCEKGRPWASVSTSTELETLAMSAACVCPSRFVETFFENALDERHGGHYGGRRWRLFDYQKPAFDYPYSLRIQASSGAGKSRLMYGRAVFALLKGGKVLVGAPTTTALRNFMDAILWQRSHSHSASFFKLVIPRVIDNNNEMRLEGPYGNWIKLFTTAKNGQLFESCHLGAGGLLIMDEAAKCPQAAWAPFFSRGEAGCFSIVASTANPPQPDCEFFRQMDDSFPLERAVESLAGGDGLSEFELRTGTAACYWDRTMMPPPHWSEEAKATAITKYGGETSERYLIFVLNIRAQAAGTTFSQAALLRARERYPYTLVRVTVSGLGCSVTTYSTDDSCRSLVPGPGFKVENVYAEDAEGALPERIVEALEHPAFDVEGLAVICADVGRNLDPSQVVMLALDGLGRLQPQARLELIRGPGSLQWRILAAMWRRWRPSRGIALEASASSLGRDIKDNLVDRNAGALPVAQVHALEWRKPTTIRDTGVEGQTQTVCHTKEAATVAIERRLEAPAPLLAFPVADAEMIRQMGTHKTVGVEDRGRKFQKKDDDILEALRAGVYQIDSIPAFRRAGALAASDEI